MSLPLRYDDTPPEPRVTGKCTDCGGDATLYCDRCGEALCDECDCEIAGYHSCDRCSWNYEGEYQTLAETHSCNPDGAHQAVRQLLEFIAGTDPKQGREKYLYKLGLLLAGVEPDDYMAELDCRVRRHERALRRQR